MSLKKIIFKPPHPQTTTSTTEVKRAQKQEQSEQTLKRSEYKLNGAGQNDRVKQLHTKMTKSAAQS